MVRGFRVKVRDTVHRITYTVFTRAGRYRVPNLPASSFEVRVLEDAFQSPLEQVELKPGESKTVSIDLKAKPLRTDGPELVDFDTLYPPGPDRDIFLRVCSGCHGKNFFHRQRRSEKGWKEAVAAMTSLEVPASPNVNGTPPLPHIDPQEKEIVLRYLVTNFGPNSPRRDIKTDDLRVDEDEVADAIYMEYDLPPMQRTEPFHTILKGENRPPLSENNPLKNVRPNHMLHDAYVAPDGKIWFGDTGGNELLRLDPKELDPVKRWKEYPIPGDEFVFIHGSTVDSKGRVYWAEMRGSRLGELDPKTGEMTRHEVPLHGGMLQVVVDSHDNVWYGIANGSALGKLDATTRKLSSWKLQTPDSHPYGFIAARNGTIWYTDIAKHQIVKFDPGTAKFTEYKTPTQPSGPRRLGEDSKGKIWFSEFMGNKLGVLDPDTGKITEYDFPLRYTQAYETWPDQEDNIWVSDGIYNSLIKFDQKTKKFTYYPMPQYRYFLPKIEMDKEGTIWFGSRIVENITAVAFKPKGNALPKSSQR